MNLLFITSDFHPLCGDTAFGHTVGHLGGSLCALGHRVTAVVPLRHPEVVDQYSFARRLSPLSLRFLQQEVSIHVFDGKLPNGIEVRLLSHPDLFNNRPAISDSEDEPLRHAALVRAALTLAAEESKKSGGWHIIHSFSLPGALAPSYIKIMSEFADVKTVFSVDSLVTQGRCDYSWVERLGLDQNDFTPEGFEFFGDLNILKAGLVGADQILFNGLSTAQDAQSRRYGGGLEGVIASRQFDIAALSPGLDYARWNPVTDVYLPLRYDAEQHSGKRSCKAHLQNTLELPVRPDAPIIVLAPPLDDLAEPLTRVLNRLMRGDIQLVAPRGLMPALAGAVEKACERWPRSIARPELDESRWHQLVAGADLIVQDAPQDDDVEILLASLRYGALPVVKRQGLVRDIVVDMSNTLESGNGFVLSETMNEGASDLTTGHELLSVLRKACALIRSGKPYTDALRRVMRQNHSWENSARRLEQLYVEMLPTEEKKSDDIEAIEQ